MELTSAVGNGSFSRTRILVLIVLGIYANRVEAIQFVEVPLPVGALVTSNFLFEGPDGGTIELSLVSRNRRGAALTPFLHVVDVDFSGSAPVVVYRGFRLIRFSDTPENGVIQHDDLAFSADVLDVTIDVVGVPGIDDRRITPGITPLPMSDWLSSEELEAIRTGLGMVDIEYQTGDTNGPRQLFGIRSVVPEPGPALLLGIGLAILGQASRRARAA